MVPCLSRSHERRDAELRNGEWPRGRSMVRRGAKWQRGAARVGAATGGGGDERGGLQLKGKMENQMTNRQKRVLHAAASVGLRDAGQYGQICPEGDVQK